MNAPANIVPANIGAFRAAKAKAIRSLMIDWAENTIALGIELRAARDTFPENRNSRTARSKTKLSRPGWYDWLNTECNLSPSYAGQYIRVADRFEGKNIKAKISASVLMFLARGTTPESAATEVVERTNRGETIGETKSRQIADKHRPSPAKANEIAKETGKPTLASDGFLYLGADPETVKHSAERRTLIYSVRRAIETLATVEVTPSQLLEWALPHQLWTKKEAEQIEEASIWLRELVKAWSARQ